MEDKVGENPVALRAAVFLLSAKSRRGGGVQTPPIRAKEMSMTIVNSVIPFQRNKHPRSVTTAGQPSAHTDFSPIYERSRLTAVIAAARNQSSYPCFGRNPVRDIRSWHSQSSIIVCSTLVLFFSGLLIGLTKPCVVDLLDAPSMR